MAGIYSSIIIYAYRPANTMAVADETAVSYS